MLSEVYLVNYDRNLSRVGYRLQVLILLECVASWSTALMTYRTPPPLQVHLISQDGVGLVIDMPLVAALLWDSAENSCSGSNAP